MNLKEAFRFQNKLQQLMGEAEYILDRPGNLTKVHVTHLRSKVMPEAQDETMLENSPTEYSEYITQVVEFLLQLLGEHEKLTAAVQRAKAAMPLEGGLDGQVSLNSTRQRIAGLLRRMASLRSSEVLEANGGTGYRFNNEGNQVTYRCDVRRVTTINFDRLKVRKLCNRLNLRADEMSMEIDRALVNTPVEYEPPFDVNDTFADVFEDFLLSAGA